VSSSSVDISLDPQERAWRAEAQDAVDGLADALALAGLPPLPALAAGRITLTEVGVHIELGGCGVRTVRALTAYLTEHARCRGRIVPGGLVPVASPELSGPPAELPAAPPGRHCTGPVTSAPPPSR
jgi:hypothetical protein